MSTTEKCRSKSIGDTLQLLLLASITCVLIVCTSACSTRPKDAHIDLVSSPVDLFVEYHAGTPLSGPSNEVVELTDDTTFKTYELRLTFLDHESPAVGQPLSIYSRLITSRGTTTAVLPATSLTRSVRWVRGESHAAVTGNSAGSDAHASSKKHRQTQPVIREVLLNNFATMQVHLRAAAATGDVTSGEQLQRQVMLAMRLVTTPLREVSEPLVIKAGQTLRLALAITDDAESVRIARRTQRRESRKNQSENGAGESVLATRAPDRITETLVVDIPLEAEGFQGSIILPFEMTDTPWKSLMLTIHETGQTASPELVAEVNASLAHWQQVVAARPSFASKQFASDRTELTSAFALLDSDSQRRSAMIFLAGRTGASFMGDLALVADDLLLELFTQQIKTSMEASTVSKIQSTGWVLDHACMKVLVEQSGQRITREAQGAMASQLGEVARRSATFQELVEESDSRDVFDTRLQAENLISLEDDSPSSRVRAFNWLSRRGMAPQGYDPLGNAQSRRTALEKNGAPSSDITTKAAGANTTDEAIPMLPSLAPMENEPLPATGSEGTR